MKLLSILLCFGAFNLHCQTLKEKANKSFVDQDWSTALASYTQLVESEEADSLDWYNLAYCQMQLEKYDAALVHFEEAKSRNVTSSFVDFNILKIHAIRREDQKFYAAFYQAVEDGLFALARIEQDSVFDSYRQDERFDELLTGVEKNAYPCLNNQDMRHFDFWLGDWDVYFQGQKVGENSITMAKGGCAVHENYITSRNYAGQSINYFDPIDKKWHQHWVGSGGDVYNYLEVDRAEGMLQFESKFSDPQGNISLSRLTFTLNEDGTVRQLFESSYDDGNTWSNAFDGLYRRQN